MFKKYFDNGFADYLIPIMPIGCKISPNSKIKQGGKIPGMPYANGWGGIKNWQTLIVTEDDVLEWDEFGASYGTKNAGVGIRTSGFPFIDIDIDDNELLAGQIRKIVENKLGATCIRYRENSTRLGMLYKMKSMHLCSKVVVKFNDNNKVELLGDGQQFVAHGEHASGNNYKWRDQKLNSVELPNANDLIEVTEDDLVELADELIAFAIKLGYDNQLFTRNKESDSSNKSKKGKSKAKHSIQSKSVIKLDHENIIYKDLVIKSFTHGEFTLQDLRENPDEYEGALCKEVLDNDYNNGQEDIVEVFNNGTNIILHSFAHGGINYIVELLQTQTYREHKSQLAKIRDTLIFNNDIKNKQFWRRRDNDLVSKISLFKIYQQTKDLFMYMDNEDARNDFNDLFHKVSREIYHLYDQNHLDTKCVLVYFETVLEKSGFFPALRVNSDEQVFVTKQIWENVKSEFAGDEYRVNLFNDSTQLFYELSEGLDIEMAVAGAPFDQRVCAILNAERMYKIGEMLRKLATIKLGKELLFVRLLINKKYQFDVDYSTKDSIKNLLGNNFVYTYSKKNESTMDITRKEVFSIWMGHSDRVDFKGEVFRPHSQSKRIEDPFFFKGFRKDDNLKFLNLFMGYTYYPVVGECDFILRHIKYAWCGGNQAVYNFVIKWYAFMLQYPGVSPEVSWIINSDQGLGKGLIDGIFERYLGVHYLKVEKIEDITGQFNDSLYRKILVNNNEATQISEKTVHSILKAYQDAKSYLMNAKGSAKRTVELCLHLTTFSNTGYFVKLEKKERRNFFIVPDNDYVERVHGDKDSYYDRLDACCNGKEAVAFISYLSKIDLSAKASETYSHQTIITENGDTFEEYGDFEKELEMKDELESYYGQRDSIKYDRGVLFEDDYTTEIDCYTGWHPRNMPIIYNPERTENIISNLGHVEKWWISKLASRKFHYRNIKEENNSIDYEKGHLYSDIKEDYENYCRVNKVHRKERNIRVKVREMLCGGKDKLKVELDGAKRSGTNKYLEIADYVMEKKVSGYDKLIIDDIDRARRVMETSLDKSAKINWDNMVEGDSNVVNLFGVGMSG